MVLFESAGSSQVSDAGLLPFALLVFPADRQHITIACRQSGIPVSQSKLLIAGGTARFTDLCDDVPADLHLAALARVGEWLPALDGEYPINWVRDHRALVETDGEVISVDTRMLEGTGISDVLALAWAGALLVASGYSPRQAVQHVAEIYRNRSADERALAQSVLADGLDAGNLFGLFLSRMAEADSTNEVERLTTWFFSQRDIDLPYDRRSIANIFTAEMDPDQRRQAIYEELRQYNYHAERMNITRIVTRVRRHGEELIFGRMSRAFHNQALLFANAGYVRANEEARERLTQLMLDCAGLAHLAPALDRLHCHLTNEHGMALTATLGALELLEDAVLTDQRRQIEGIINVERGESNPVSATYQEVFARTERLLSHCSFLRKQLLAAPRRSAAFVILSQRISPLGGHLLAKINELQEPYLGKAENLKSLVRGGGRRMYASADYTWLQHADHWVEAIPLFIKEQVMVVDGEEVTETVIDQQTMEETFREQFADHWALNIDHVTDSEHVALARECIDQPEPTAEHIGRAAAKIAEAYRQYADVIHQQAERREINRCDALRTWWKEHGGEYTVPHDESLTAEAVRLAEIAELPQRDLPTLHVLTTQSARMTENYICTWLEESMALFNVIRAYRLEDEVRAKVSEYRRLISTLGAGLVRELGMWAEVEEMMALANIAEDRAVARVVAGNPAIARQVGVLAVLAEYYTCPPGDDGPLVDEILAERAEELRQRALRDVYARNDLELLPKLDAYQEAHPEADEDEVLRALIIDNPDYADDLTAFTRFAAREEAIRLLDQREPSQQLAARVRDWLRNHSRLPLTTARKEVLLAHALQHLTLHPRYYYRATGGNKRFHLLYTPSRVDLGTRERESVEKWSQWVGGADQQAARVGQRIYGLINKNVKGFNSLTEPEVLKTGENASMVSHFAYSNAMSLLINSVGRGDVEDLGDQMSRRKDRFIHPGGEGYGGYCVPKDGLFLEFVLILTRAVKLRQLGIPDHLHAGVVAFAQRLLAQRAEFAGELEWEAWAMGLLEKRDELAPYFALREGDEGPIPVFQITRIARALTHLGRPELADSFDVLANLAARWGVHKIIVGGEQVNRFMPFYKAWLTYRAVADAQRLNPGRQINMCDFTVVLSGEYKPDTQDGRFSVGMRKYEIFAGTADHLTASLDVAGQDLVQLMFTGFARLWQRRNDPRISARISRLLRELQVCEDDATGIARLHELFPGYTSPAEIRMVSTMKLTTTDLLHYTSDTSLERIAHETRRRLLDAGLSENEINANMQVYGPRLARWAKLRELPANRLDTLITRIGGDIHALALSILGPQGSYETALQGADVLDTGIPNSDLLQLLSQPVKVRDLMRSGNPGSALVIIDGASGARHRAMNKLAVMRWFATGDAIGQQAIYRCVGIGADTIESWRAEMQRQRARAGRLYDALAADRQQDAAACYAEIVTEIRDGQELAQWLDEEERMIRFRRVTAQETTVARALTAIASGLPLNALDFGSWLALGGQFITTGMTPAQLQQLRAAFEQAVAALGGATPVAEEARISALFCPAFEPAAEGFREEKGVESSNKATEEVVEVALDTRKRLAARAAYAKTLREREAAFQAEMKRHAEACPSLEELTARAFEVRGDGAGMGQAAYGQMQALTRLAFIVLGNELYADEPAHLAQLTARVEALFHGRELDVQQIRAISGGYEDHGDIARLANIVADALRKELIDEAERDWQLQRIANVAELFDCCRAIDATIGFLNTAAEPQAVWRALADFFAESLNDHFYEYRPWAYARGIGFAHLHGDALYALAENHHRWLYRYLRTITLQCTELKELSPDELAELLGDMDTAVERPPIGAGNVPGEQRWRAYCLLRELAFIRNDGFPLPQVFPAFDPEIIDAAGRTNMAFLYPVGRTHVSRALAEGPTLTRELCAQGRPGMNLLITGDAQVTDLAGMRRPVLQATDGHLYISRREYITALERHRGLSHHAAEELADQHAGEKGVRIAARFTQPITLAVIVPFHGHPKFTSGLLEELGLPYSSQSLFHTWTTYDKAKYPAIFSEETGVGLPGEIDWLAAWTNELGEGALKAIEYGDADRGFSGLRDFAGRYPLVMVKDAAESGGRGQKSFTLCCADGTPDDAAIADACAFIHAISLKHNVAIQEVIISSPEYWATEAFMQSFVDRQIQEWGVGVNRTQRPRTPLFGSHRLIFSCENPATGAWHISHPITLNSRQLITNVGRGGTLELCKPEFIRPEFRAQLWTRLEEAGVKAMRALAEYGEKVAEQYRRETGREIGQDATGLSYATPRYMMLDFLVQPVFAEEGTLIDFEPLIDDHGERTGVRFVLQQGEKRIDGTVVGWRVVLIEPNIGIGLWDRVALREEAFARAKGELAAEEIGVNARIVLRDFARAGEDYLAAISEL